MSLYKKWKDTIEENSKDSQQQNKFWNEFCTAEKGIYEIILDNNHKKINGIVNELAEKYKVSDKYFMGFLDGINDSIVNSLELETIEINSEIDIEIDFEKLYYNMLAVPAEWLFSLPQWENILSYEKRKEIKKEYNKSKIIVNDNKIGRNDPCPCGSGKKFKKCCSI